MIFSESHGRDFDLIVCGTPGPGQADRWTPAISSYGPGNPQCSARDAAGQYCAGPAGHPDGSDHANLNGTWPAGGDA